MMKKEKIGLNRKTKKMFEELKERFTKKLVLAVPSLIKK